MQRPTDLLHAILDALAGMHAYMQNSFVHELRQMQPVLCEESLWLWAVHMRTSKHATWWCIGNCDWLYM